MKKIGLLSGVLMELLVLAACGGDPAKERDAHLKRGDDFIASSKIAEAVVEYKLAVKADNLSGRAHQKLAEGLLQSEDSERSYIEFVRAADLLPADLTAQLRSGRVLLLAGRYDDARARAEKALALEPGNVDAHILKGNAMAGLKDFAGAIAQVQEAIQTDPSRSSGYAHLGMLQVAKGDLTAAEGAFKRALAGDPKSIDARLALANLYWSSGRRKEAEEQIKGAIQYEPTNALANRALAILYLVTNRAREAEAPLKIVAESMKSSSGQIALADYYAINRRVAEARAIYEKVVASGDGAATAKLRLASLGLLQGDRPGAYRLINEILEKDAGDGNALIALAQLQLEDGKTAEALTNARKATRAAPNSPQAHYILGRILSSESQLEDAGTAYKDAIKASVNFAPANVELARIGLLSGHYAEAIQFAQAAIDKVPGYGEAYILLARAYVANGNPAAAEAPLKVLETNIPDNPAVLAEVGRLRFARGDEAAARLAFERALSKDPAQLTAIEGLIALDLKQNKSVDARRRLASLESGAAAKSSEAQLAAARAYATSLKDLGAAEAAVRRAVAADPNNLAAFDLLARIYVQNNNLPAATAEFEKLTQRQPKSVANQTALGVLYELQHKPGEAKTAYERALALDPTAGVAANNLAAMYSDRNENIDVALGLAKTAKASLPASHEVDDTLGWVYYKKGMGGYAVDSLKAAVAAQPENAIYLYHLGAAYALNHDASNARLTLQKALGKGAFDGADEARRILDSVK